MTNPEEFNLSSKIIEADNKRKDNGFIFEKDVKEFIRRLKEELDNNQVDYANLDYLYKETAMEIIDKLAGEKLK